MRLTANKFSHVSILRFTYPAVATAIILYLLPTNPFWIFVIVPFFAIPNGMQLANFSALLSQRTPPKERGETLGINASFTALGQALPPLLQDSLRLLLLRPLQFLLLDFLCFVQVCYLYILKEIRQTISSLLLNLRGVIYSNVSHLYARNICYVI